MQRFLGTGRRKLISTTPKRPRILGPGPLNCLSFRADAGGDPGDLRPGQAVGVVTRPTDWQSGRRLNGFKTASAVMRDLALSDSLGWFLSFGRQFGMSGVQREPSSKKSSWKWLLLYCGRCRSLWDFSESVIEFDARLPSNFSFIADCWISLSRLPTNCGRSRVSASGQQKDFSPLRFHKAVAQSATSQPYC